MGLCVNFSRNSLEIMLSNIYDGSTIIYRHNWVIYYLFKLQSEIHQWIMITFASFCVFSHWHPPESLWMQLRSFRSTPFSKDEIMEGSSLQQSCLQTSTQLRRNIYSKTFNPKLWIFCCSLWWGTLTALDHVLGFIWFVAQPIRPIQHSWFYRRLQWSALSDRTAASCVCSGKNCPKTVNCLSARASRSESCSRRHGDRCRWTERLKHIIIVIVNIS